MGKWAKKQVYLHFCQSVTLPPLDCKGLNQGLAEFFFSLQNEAIRHYCSTAAVAGSARVIISNFLMAN